MIEVLLAIAWVGLGLHAWGHVIAQTWIGDPLRAGDWLALVGCCAMGPLAWVPVWILRP